MAVKGDPELLGIIPIHSSPEEFTLKRHNSSESLDLSTDSSEEAILAAGGGSEEDSITSATQILVPPPPRKRKISVRYPAHAKQEEIKQGYLMQQGRKLQRWSKRYIVISGDRLLVSKKPEDKLREEIVLKDVNVAENSTKNINHSFTVLTPFQQVVFAANSRKEMEEWIGAFNIAASKTKHDDGDLETFQHLEGHHSWFACTHSRPTYCNVCKEMLHGVAWHGLSCEVCKFKSHRRCVFLVKQACKWTTRANLEKEDVRVGQDFSIPHQWLEGNLHTGSKCVICDRACGSVRRLQDYRCMWCKWTVHTECMEHVSTTCTLGEHRLSILPPSALQRSDAIKKAMWEPYKVYGHSPVLALVNSKSGDNQGVKFLRKLKYWLNPVQVFDLAISGPDLGLQLFQRFEKFRIIILGGDGSIGWVLAAVDKYNLHSKCMVGVVPLGTGNDMARVLGWGARCDEEEKLPSILTEMEQSSFKLLDRWCLQFTTDSTVDLTPLFRSNSPTKSISGLPSPGKPVPIPDSAHPMAPFPGPGTSLESRTSLQSPDQVLSPQDSSSTSDSEYKSASSRTPSPEYQPRCNGVSGVDSPDNATTNKRHLSNTSSSSSLGLNRFAGCSQPPAKVEAFHGSLAAHLSTILLSDDAATVISSAQVLCEVINDFIASVLDDREQNLPMSEFVSDSLVQRCTALHKKLQGLVGTLRKEVAAAGACVEEGQEEEKVLHPRDALMTRANSLKKAVRAVIDMTEKVVDSQAQTTLEIEALVEGTQNGNGRKPNGMGGHVPFVRISSSSSVMSVVEPAPLLPETKEIATMNNYFGIGLDAKITYQFNTTREKNPAQYKNRIKNMMLYGILGGKEFFARSQRYLDRRIQLECDGVPVQLPQSLQGLVFLNIPSYMAGTNFWGTEKEKDGFCAPSHDDKLLEVVGITGMAQVATSKVLGIQKQRLTQCRCAKITLLGPDTHAVQVDGEAWLQEPGTIVLSHKNKARMLVKDKAFAQSLESWKQKNLSGASHSTTSLPSFANISTLPEVLTMEELERYREMGVILRPLIDCIKSEATVNSDVAKELVPLMATMSASLDRVFPDNQVSETADVEHLQDLERAMRAVVQETLWFLNVKKISSERECRMRECVQGVEVQMKKVISSAEISTASITQHGFRRASDTLVMSCIPSPHPKYSPGLSAHRERSSLLVPDPTIIAAAGAKKIGKEVHEWNTDDVCQWMLELGLGEYEQHFRSRDITGRDLIDLQKADFQDLGITKIGPTTRLRQGIQALRNPLNTRVRETR